MSWPTVPTIFWVCLTTLNVAAAYRAVTRGHGVQTTLAWILAIMAFPYFGAGAYFLLANPSVGKISRRKRLTAAAVHQAVCQIGDGLPAEVASTFRPEERSLLHLAISITRLPATAGNTVRLLTRLNDAFESMENCIYAAKKSIWVECYIIRNDETGLLFLDLLAERASQGLEVRLLYDAFGSLGLDAARLKAIRANGGRAEPFLPMNPLRRRWAIHLRNHRKLVVVDGEVGFTGGMNMADEYSGRTRRKGGQFFRDSHLELRGPSVGHLARIFSEDWAFATGEELPCPEPPPEAPGGRSVVAVLPSGPDQENNASALTYFAGIGQARERCYLTSPYFIPDEPTLQALISASLRGVDVRLLVPFRSDMRLVATAARSYYPQLIRAGVRVYEYLPRMLHAKTMVVDGAWGIVGSANVDIRSFWLNFELGALIVDPTFAARLEERFRADLAESREITRENLTRRTLFRKLWESIARLLSPLL